MRNFYQKAIVITMVLGNYSASDAMLSSFVKSFSTKTSLFSLSGADFVRESIERRKLSGGRPKELERLVLEFNCKGDRTGLDKLLPGKPGNLVIRPPLHCDDWSRIMLGDNVFLNNDCVFLTKHGVEIGSNMWMAPKVHLYTELPSLIREEFSDLAPEGPIKIGKSCWIGGGVKIFPGVTIGDETVIGAGSFVTESIPSGVIAAGFPCKVRKAVKDIAPLKATVPSYAVTMTERDKMLRGIPCIVSPELNHMLNITEEISLRFNMSGNQMLLEELFQQKLSGVKVEPPFYCDHGIFIKLGKNVVIGSGCTFLSAGGIEIGDNTIFGPQAQLYAAGHSFDPTERNAGLCISKRIKIGANCHIGRGAIVIPDVEIGDGAKILEGSVVTKNVPAGATVGGNPARIIETSERK